MGLGPFLTPIRLTPRRGGFEGSWRQGVACCCCWVLSTALIVATGVFERTGWYLWDPFQWVIARALFAIVCAFVVAAVVILGGGALLDLLLFHRRKDGLSLVASGFGWRAIPLALGAGINFLAGGVVGASWLLEDSYSVRDMATATSLVASAVLLGWSAIRGMSLALMRIGGRDWARFLACCLNLALLPLAWEAGVAARDRLDPWKEWFESTERSERQVEGPPVPGTPSAGPQRTQDGTSLRDK